MKKISLRMFMCLLMIWGLTTFTFAVPGKLDNAKCDHGQVKKQLQSYFQQLAEEEFFSGSVLVAKEGKILLKKGYGMADYETDKKNKPRTIHAIASFTKAFASMSIMMLEERGLLSVNDSIADYIPEFPNGDRIMIHHLLSHSSGLYEYLWNPLIWGNITTYHAPDDLLPYYMHEELQFETGTKFQYSNSNYITLGIIIERVSGMSFRDFIKTNILKPLKMKHTSYDPFEEDFAGKKSTGYFDITTDPPTAAFYLHPSIPYTAGAMQSNVLDLYKWDQALYTNKLVSEESLEKMFTPGHGDYGYGWYIDDLAVNGETYRQVWHWGSFIGFYGHFSRLVDEKVTIILLLNTNSPTDTPNELKPIIENVTEILFKKD